MKLSYTIPQIDLLYVDEQDVIATSFTNGISGFGDEVDYNDYIVK